MSDGGIIDMIDRAIADVDVSGDAMRVVPGLAFREPDATAPEQEGWIFLGVVDDDPDVDPDGGGVCWRGLASTDQWVALSDAEWTATALSATSSAAIALTTVVELIVRYE